MITSPAVASHATVRPTRQLRHARPRRRRCHAVLCRQPCERPTRPPPLSLPLSRSQRRREVLDVRRLRHGLAAAGRRVRQAQLERDCAGGGGAGVSEQGVCVCVCVAATRLRTERAARARATPPRRRSTGPRPRPPHSLGLAPCCAFSTRMACVSGTPPACTPTVVPDAGAIVSFMNLGTAAWRRR